jgi:hypothetical protein
LQLNLGEQIFLFLGLSETTEYYYNQLGVGGPVPLINIVGARFLPIAAIPLYVFAFREFLGNWKWILLAEA